MLTPKPKQLLDAFSRSLPNDFGKLFDEARFQRLAVDIPGKLPNELFLRPSEWSVYIETPGLLLGDGTRQPVAPEITKTKSGPRLFPPNQPITWDVGLRMGAALRIAQRAHLNNPLGGGIRVRPHVRRAHWHGYWHGPREGGRNFKLKWLPPVAVKVDSEDALAVLVREVAK